MSIRFRMPTRQSSDDAPTCACSLVLGRFEASLTRCARQTGVVLPPLAVAHPPPVTQARRSPGRQVCPAVQAGRAAVYGRRYAVTRRRRSCSGWTNICCPRGGGPPRASESGIDRSIDELPGQLASILDAWAHPLPPVRLPWADRAGLCRTDPLSLRRSSQVTAARRTCRSA